MSHSGETYADKILLIIDEHNGEIPVGELRDHFGTRFSGEQVSVTGALNGLRDKGYITISGGNHKGSQKIIKKVTHHICQGARLIKLTDIKRWDKGLSPNRTDGLKSSHNHFDLMCG